VDEGVRGVVGVGVGVRERGRWWRIMDPHQPYGLPECRLELLSPTPSGQMSTFQGQKFNKFCSLCKPRTFFI
jgi:hypothetical protein